MKKPETDPKMRDKFISFLRKNDGGEPADNTYVARMGWLLILMVGLIAVWLAAPEFSKTASSTTAGLQEALKFTAATAAITIFAASLRWPSRKIEGWLDEHYPEHQTDYDYGDYSVRGDVHSSLWMGGLWGFRIAIAYAVVSILLAMSDVLSALAESGYPISADQVARLTVLNSFALATLTTLLAGLGFWWLIDWSMKETAEELHTPERSTFGIPTDAGQQVATDGGENDGA